MSGNSLLGLKEAGQSVWIDYLSRDLINSGELGRLIEEDGVSGVTSNPSIFQKAIEGSDAYDGQLRELVAGGARDEKEIFLNMAMKDVGDAADLLLPVYEKTGGKDGFVSIEVSPDLAYETEKTVAEAHRLFDTLGRKNILIKVPATVPGLAAIERLTADGVNVNVTLLFSVDRYRAVAEAYMKGLVKRIGRDRPLDGIASVASFFVSRVDTLVDKLLKEHPREQADRLRGKAAVANARLAYSEFRRLISGKRWGALGSNGANVQRLLWGSTSTKDPAYSDIKYVTELIGPDTVNTMPEDTMTAFKDHGIPKAAIGNRLDEADALFEELEDLGIGMEDVAGRLEREGVKKFSDSFFDVLNKVAGKRDRMLKEKAA